MKQLLDASRGSYVIFGLNDRVFVGRCSPTTSGLVGTHHDKKDAVPDQGAISDQQHLPDASGAVLYELDLCKESIAVPSSAPLMQNDAASAEGTGADGHRSSCGVSSHQGDKHPYQVQAVTIAKKGNVLICGVACYNKSLLVYEIDLRIAASAGAGSVNSGGTNVVTVPLKASHKTFKRCCCLCFATVPKDQRVIGTEKADGDEDGMLTLVAGDLTGDAVAFPCQTAHAPAGEAEAARPDAKPPASASLESSGWDVSAREDVPKNCRLLLGHTASMLTGVRVVHSHVASGRTQCKILTSDRDEKVRVSSFPDAFRIEGYLLGHEAFISALDVATDAKHRTPRCVTCSGDGTVRLWDYDQFQEVACYSPDNELVPSRVAITSTGGNVAVIYDESPRVDILRVNDGVTEVELRLACTFELPSSALSLAWLDDDTEGGSAGNSPATLIILLTDTPFVQIFHLDVSCRSPVPVWTLPIVSALSESLAGEAVVMPSSVLEKDQSGKLTMTKNRERKRPGALDRPWNNPERKHIAKEREKRYKISKHPVNDQESSRTNSPPS